jgi:hypothetical protein
VLPSVRAGLACALLLGVLACGQAPGRDSTATVDSTTGAGPTFGASAVTAAVDVSIPVALDSCNADTAPNTRWSGIVRSFGPYTLFLPDSVRMLDSDSITGTLKLSWPRCPEQCSFTVTVYPDSGLSLEVRVARLVAQQRRIDSVNTLPGVAATEFDELDGPPRPFRTSAAQGFAIDHSCGDCAATTLKFERSGHIADVSLTADAFPEAWRRMCEMTVVGKSFAWLP